MNNMGHGARTWRFRRIQWHSGAAACLILEMRIGELDLAQQWND
jgi:hypothetical protein